MKMFGEILVPTDLSNSATAALEAAAALAKVYDSRIHLHHTIADVDSIPLEFDVEIEIVEGHLKVIQADLENRGIRVASPTVNVGRPFEKITEYADHNDIDMTIIGSRGQTKGSHAIGMTAEKVVRKSSTPIWVVREGSVVGASRIVCAVDFSRSSEKAMDSAIQLARDLGAELTVLHVVAPFPGFAYGLDRSSRRKVADYHAREREEFDAFLSGFDLVGFKWHKAMRHGEPAGQIVGLARDIKADLVVMGTLGRAGLERMLIGSTTEKVVREMPCSVMAIKSEGIIRLRVEEEIMDVEGRFSQGETLLEKGSQDEAIRHFEYCITRDFLFAPAYEALATAHEAMGHVLTAAHWRDQAKYIHQKNWQRKVEAEIRDELWSNRSERQRVAQPA